VVLVIIIIIQIYLLEKGKEYLYSLEISNVKHCLDMIDFLNKKIQEMDNEIKILANNDRYVRHLITIPGISYYTALLISSEIAVDINRFFRLRTSIIFLC
jgi:hypothetical protein